jgi:hypothetical protein
MEMCIIVQEDNNILKRPYAPRCGYGADTIRQFFGILKEILEKKKNEYIPQNQLISNNILTYALTYVLFPLIWQLEKPSIYPIKFQYYIGITTLALFSCLFTNSKGYGVRKPRFITHTLMIKVFLGSAIAFFQLLYSFDRTYSISIRPVFPLNNHLSCPREGDWQ